MIKPKRNMAKIPFDIKYRPQIESGEYKVETRDGRSVEIVKWDFRSLHGKTPILAIIHGDYDYNHTYSEDGYSIFESDKLFIVTSEEELSEFEKRLFELRHIAKRDIYSAQEWQTLRNESAELLSLAREQFIKDGYVIEKKIFHDAVKRVDPGIMEEVSENVDMTEYEKGRADALKDLPRWRKCNQLSTGQTTVVIGYTKDEDALYRNGRVISLLDLEKLPGFKEDEQ